MVYYIVCLEGPHR